jgi:N-acetylmuramoyl-L-alanine amidase
MPGAIVEALFVSNDLDAAVLATPGGRNAIVTAYEEAIVQYFTEYPPA